MNSTQNSLKTNQPLSGTWPIQKNRPILDESYEYRVNQKSYHDSELDLTRNDSNNQIFMTASSQNIEINHQNRNTTSKKPGRFVTTSFRKSTSNRETTLFTCPICCENMNDDDIKQMPCCEVKLCSLCLLTHTITNINNGKTKIECPSCSQQIDSTTILYNTELPAPIRERYQQALARDLFSEQKNILIKLCPHCTYITILDENDPHIHERKSHRSIRPFLICEHCGQEWCWSCYAPAHPNRTCRQIRRNRSQLDTWAKTRRAERNNQRNAQRCPKCSIYIEKIDGCDHMVCSRCNSKFCYRCGSRMRLPYLIGHDAKYSIFGCRYKLWPNRPLLRWLIRGTIFCGVLLISPVALAAIIALIAIGIPTILIVGCFTLPVYICVECRRR